MQCQAVLHGHAVTVVRRKRVVDITSSQLSDIHLRQSCGVSQRDMYVVSQRDMYIVSQRYMRNVRCHASLSDPKSNNIDDLSAVSLEVEGQIILWAGDTS